MPVSADLQHVSLGSRRRDCRQGSAYSSLKGSDGDMQGVECRYGRCERTEGDAS